MTSIDIINKNILTGTFHQFLMIQTLAWSAASNYLKKRKRSTDTNSSYGRKKSKLESFQSTIEHDYAVLSKATYAKTKYKRQEQVNQHKTQYEWYLNRELSNDLTSVFESEDKVVVAYRGTYLDQPVGDLLTGDLADDLILALGGESYLTRFKTSANEFKSIQQYYKGTDKEFIVTGHSLGGTIAKYMHNTYGNVISESHLFNPGAGLTSIIDPNIQDNMYVYHVTGDPLSLLSNYNDSNVTIFDSQSLNAHTIDNFL